MSGTASQTFQVNITSNDQLTAVLQQIGRSLAGVNAQIATVARVSAPLAQVTQQVGAAMARVNEVVAPIAASMRGMAMGFIGATTAAAGLSGILGAGALVGMARGTAQASAEIERLRQSLRGTEEMRRLTDASASLDAQLQSLAFSARANGMSVEGLTQPLQRVSTLLSDLGRGGGGQARQVLQQLGLSFRDAQGALISAPEMMANIARALEANPNNDQRARIMQAIFGSDLGGNTQLQQMLVRFRQDNERFLASGGPLGQEDRKGLAAMQTAMEALSAVAERLKAALGAAVAPAIQRVAEVFSGLVRANRDLIATQVGAWAQQLADAIQAINWRGVSGAISGVINGLSWVLRNTGGLTTAIAAAGAAMTAAFAGPAVAAIGGVVAVLGGPLTLGIAAVGAATYGIVTYWDQIKAGAEAVGRAFVVWGTTLAEVFRPLASFVGDVLAPIGRAIDMFMLQPIRDVLALMRQIIDLTPNLPGAGALARPEAVQQEQHGLFAGRANMAPGIGNPSQYLATDEDRDPRVPGLPRMPALPTRDSIAGRVEVFLRMEGLLPGVTATARTSGEGVAPAQLDVGQAFGGTWR